MQEIKKIDIWSLVKISLLFGLVMGIICGIFMSFIFSAYSKNINSIANNPQASAIFSGVDINQLSQSYQQMSRTALYQVPLISVISMLISSLIGGFLYNLFVKWVGGIKVELEDYKKK